VFDGYDFKGSDVILQINRALVDNILCREIAKITDARIEEKQLKIGGRNINFYDNKYLHCGRRIVYKIRYCTLRSMWI
jgi:hypothetical protein